MFGLKWYCNRDNRSLVNRTSLAEGKFRAGSDHKNISPHPPKLTELLDEALDFSQSMKRSLNYFFLEILRGRKTTDDIWLQFYLFTCLSPH